MCFDENLGFSFTGKKIFLFGWPVNGQDSELNYVYRALLESKGYIG